MHDAEVALALLECNAVGFTPEQPITFKSGIRSPVYVDNRRLPFVPAAWRIIVNAFASFLEGGRIPCDVIAGVAVGGVPHSAALAYSLGKPSVFIRKETKGYGKNQLVEGGDVTGQRVILIEDLVTTGSSSLAAVAALRESGAIVTDVLAIVQYGFSEAREAFAAAHVTLHTLTTFPSILAAALRTGHLSPHQHDIVRKWLDNPYQW
jgi:orotate phosphoribosyltransferase